MSSASGPLLSPHFELQGHRGARGLKPENTLPSFEIAFDHGVTAIETDLHLSRDGIVVLCHDPLLGSRFCSQLPCPEGTPINRITLAQLRSCRVDRNPDPRRFPEQNAEVTPVAALFAEGEGVDPFAVPTLADLFAFADAYAGHLGERAGKSDEQRERARHTLFDLELKRVSLHPKASGDDFQGRSGRLERAVVETVQAASMEKRTRVRSFDHRCVQALREIAPHMERAVLVGEDFLAGVRLFLVFKLSDALRSLGIGTSALVDLAEVARRAGAKVYCPNYVFLDEKQVRQAHSAGVRIIPWTVNAPAAWDRLLRWGVDGITTDYPDRLSVYLRTKGVAW